MRTRPDDPPSALAGLGPRSEEALRAAGVTSVDQLRSLGSVRTYLAVRRVWPGASLNLLWALEGAITGTAWQTVAKEHRLSLLLALEAAKGDALHLIPDGSQGSPPAGLPGMRHPDSRKRPA